MAALTLTRDSYRDKVYGGWLGKNIGGTFGAPVEGKKEINDLKFYDPLPGQAAANDDLDIQLVWLHALREHGIDVTSEQLTNQWLDHVTYPWDEYGYATYNMRRELCPPITGAFNNWFRQSLGGARRAELWAMIAPGAPQVAAEYAYRDGILDHAQEGVWAQMFWSAMESAAFFLSEPQTLLDIGLAMVPAASRIARAVQAARDAFRDQATPLEARTRILTAVGSENYSDAPQNVGVAVLGWLYGKGDFGASLCAAVNCGYDTGSTGAMLGALLGILRGKSGLPEDWLKPIGDAVVLGWGVVNLDVERTVAELTEHTMAIGEQVVAAKCPDVALVDSAEAVPTIPSEGTAAGPVSPPSTSGFVAPDLTADLPTAPETPQLNERARFLELDVPAVESTASSAPATPAEPDLAAPPPDLTPQPPSLEAAAETAAGKGETESAAGAASPFPSEPAGESGKGAEGLDSPDTPTTDLPMTSDTPSAPPLEAPPPAPAPTPMEAAINWRDNTRIKPLLVAPINTAIYHAGVFEIVVDYGEGGPAIIPNTATSLMMAIRNAGGSDFMGTVSLSAQAGWQVAVPGAQGQRQMLTSGGMARYGFVIRVPDTVPLEPKNSVTLVLTPESGAPTTCEIPLLGGSCWWFVGPFQNFADEGFDKAYPVEDKPGLENDYLGRAGALIKWQKMAFKETVMRLDDVFTGVQGVAYGVTTLRVPTPADAKIATHTSDGVKVWLNNQRVLQYHNHGEFRPTLGYGPATADVTLRAGDNRVMIKVVQCSSEPVQLSFAVTDRNGQPLLDLGNTRW